MVNWERKEYPMSKSNYTVDSIKVLSDIEHIRLRYGMYIGGNSHPGHLFSEAYDNALDELQNGYATKVVVRVDTKNNIYTVIDDGRGIPIGMKEAPDGTQKSALELLLTKANSGGKFDNEGYRLRSGLHGLGSTIINALSESMEVDVVRDNKHEHIKCHLGEVVDHLIESNESNEHGTQISFTPDAKVFETDKIPKQFIVNRCKIASALALATELYVDDAQVDVSSDIFDLIPVDEDISIYTKTRFKVEDKSTGESMVIAMMYTSDTSWWYGGYTNLLHNPNGGTHFRIMDDAIYQALESYKIEGVLSKDYYLGVKLVVAAFISDPSFSSQTKEKLSVDKKSLDKFTPMIVKEIKKWLDSDPDTRDGIFKRMQENRAAQTKLLNQKDINKLVIKNTNVSGKGIRRKSVVSKLIECTSTDRSNTELYIVEGDSASGSFLPVRNRKTQAILPLRGKILNVSRLDDPLNALKNNEVLDIVNGVGAGLMDDSDPAASRYEKIVIASDADSDGKHIAALVIGLVVNLLPNLVKAGMLYMVEPALYSWKDKHGLHFTNDLKDIPSGCEMTRFKGLGEMDPEEVDACLTNPATRKLIRINYPDDLAQMNAVLTSSSVRRRLLEEMGVIKYE